MGLAATSGGGLADTRETLHMWTRIVGKIRLAHRPLINHWWWPGGGEDGAFYAYAYPEPAGFGDYPVRPAAASYRADLGEFVLPYEAVASAADPDRDLGEFLHSSYAAAAELAHWDRAALEDDPARWDAQHSQP